MTEKALAALSFLCLVAFLGVVVWFVPEVDLAIVTLGVLALAFYDFYISAFRNRQNKD